MMTDPVTRYDSYYRIDTPTWLNRRVGSRHDERSAALQDFARSEVFDLYHPAIDIAGRMQLWCAAHQFFVGDGALFEYDDSCLTQTLTIVLAATSGVPREALALVSVDRAAPEVFADVTTDEGYWRDAETITITCPGEHHWTWDGGSSLHGADGSEYRAADLFNAGQVISRCRDCAAFDDDTTDTMCACVGVAIYWRTCDQRCQAGQPEIPTFEETR
jgi:hypothetical protein